jgi:RNA polymerase sigma-70 factor (ECF subfamily)
VPGSKQHNPIPDSVWESVLRTETEPAEAFHVAISAYHHGRADIASRALRIVARAEDPEAGYAEAVGRWARLSPVWEAANAEMARRSEPGRAVADQVEVEDAALLAQIAGGDLGRPLEELYDRYAARLHGLGLRLLGDPGLAEELVQETFVRLWQSAGRYDPQRGSVTSFVFTIARRLTIDLRRRPSSRPFAELEADQGPERDPGDAVDRLLVGLHVRDALNSLPDGQREVLELLYLQDLTQRQVADRVGVPLGTVKTRAFYGLRTLKEALAERDVDV